MLDAVVVPGESGGTEQVDRAVGADEARAGCGRLGSGDERGDEDCRASDEPSHTVVLLPAMTGWRLDDRPAGRFPRAYFRGE